ARIFLPVPAGDPRAEPGPAVARPVLVPGGVPVTGASGRRFSLARPSGRDGLRLPAGVGGAFPRPRGAVDVVSSLQTPTGVHARLYPSQIRFVHGAPHREQ